MLLVPSDQNFSFPEGFMTFTVADIFALLGLRPIGALAHPLMAVGTSSDEDVLNGVSLSYNDFDQQMKGSSASPVTRKNAVSTCFGYVGSWLAPPPNGSSTTTCLLLDAW
jgi:hypothetical protein